MARGTTQPTMRASPTATGTSLQTGTTTSVSVSPVRSPKPELPRSRPRRVCQRASRCRHDEKGRQSRPAEPRPFWPCGRWVRSSVFCCWRHTGFGAGTRAIIDCSGPVFVNRRYRLGEEGLSDVFISYRREFDAGWAGRLATDLTQAFAERRVFHDSHSAHLRAQLCVISAAGAEVSGFAELVRR